MTDRALAGQPVAWIRFCSDGSYEGPLADSAIDDVRKRSGAWTPLYRSPPPPLLQQAVEALEMAQTGLKWYRDMHPEDADGSDDEADAEIDATLTALRAAMEGQTK